MRQAIWIVWIAAALAQDQPSPPVVVSNTGTPMRLPFRCTEGDMRWAGMSCSREDPCPVYLELTAVEPTGGQLFVTGNIHAQTVTLYSVLLGSDDAGKTWREAFPRIRGAGLDHLQFADLANGWASGQELSPLPQEPFLLSTTDGGKTWQRRAVFDETRVGSIQQFFFSSKSDGSLVFDRGQGSESGRYELYESPNGGATWVLKQASSRALRLKNGPAEPALWRVRADGPTQSFRIEHQQGERWNAAASFLVDLGTCQPEPLSLAPTEPEPAPAPAPTPAPRSRPKK